MSTIDILGYSWQKAESILRSAGINYHIALTKPTRNFFQLEEKALYVIRQEKMDDGSLQLVLAARLRKEVS